MDNDFNFSALIIKSSSVNDEFYDELKTYIESLHCKASIFEFSDSEQPPIVDLWIGNSDDRAKLDSAPSYVRTVDLGAVSKINDDVKNIVAINIIKIKKISEFQDKIIRLANKICIK